MRIILKCARIIQDLQVFLGDAQTVDASPFFFFVMSGLGKHFSQLHVSTPSNAWCVLTCDVNKCAFVVSYVYVLVVLIGLIW